MSEAGKQLVKVLDNIMMPGFSEMEKMRVVNNISERLADKLYDLSKRGTYTYQQLLKLTVNLSGKFANDDAIIKHIEEKIAEYYSKVTL